jgi:hypothetical protein
VSGTFTPAGTGHPYPAYHPVAELGAQPPEQVWRQQPHLGRPRGGVGRHHELAVVEGLRLGVCGQFRPDDPYPLAEDRAHRRALPPSSAGEQSAHSRVEWLGVIASRSSTVYNVGTGLIYASSFRNIRKS